MAQLDAADSMPGNWLGLGLVKNNLKVKLLKVGLASIWPGIELYPTRYQTLLKKLFLTYPKLILYSYNFGYLSSTHMIYGICMLDNKKNFKI